MRIGDDETESPFQIADGVWTGIDFVYDSHLEIRVFEKTFIIEKACPGLKSCRFGNEHTTMDVLSFQANQRQVLFSFSFSFFLVMCLLCCRAGEPFSTLITSDFSSRSYPLTISFWNAYWGNVEPLSVTESTLLAAMKTETLSAKPTETESNWTNLLELWNDRIQKYFSFSYF